MSVFLNFTFECYNRDSTATCSHDVVRVCGNAIMFNVYAEKHRNQRRSLDCERFNGFLLYKYVESLIRIIPLYSLTCGLLMEITHFLELHV